MQKNNVYQQSLKYHQKFHGKIATEIKTKLDNVNDLSLAYTPGVAEPCRQIHKNPEDVYKYTIKGNMVAVISDGSAVLGLGNIGALAAIPVMEGKAALFKKIGGVDAFPICLQSQDVAKNIETIKNIAPVFGGINLEDFKAPQCFEIEQALQNLGIPVVHDDQHGTAIVLLAGLTNALKVVDKKLNDVKIVVSGVGAAGTAIIKLLVMAGCDGKRILACDTTGIIYTGRPDLAENKFKNEIASLTNLQKIQGDLTVAILGADVFVGVSKGNILTAEMAKSMNKKAIIFVMANPTPEIDPVLAKKCGAMVVATGRSDFPNQVNNALVFPGLFRGLLDCRAVKLTDKMKIAAARALAGVIKKPTASKILPPVFDRCAARAVAKAIIASAPSMN